MAFLLGPQTWESPFPVVFFPKQRVGLGFKSSVLRHHGSCDTHSSAGSGAARGGAPIPEQLASGLQLKRSTRMCVYVYAQYILYINIKIQLNILIIYTVTTFEYADFKTYEQVF